MAKTIMSVSESTGVTIPICELFELETIDLFTAQKKARLIHRMKNIGSSGDEVEVAVRDFFQRRLAKRCDVGNGHIVDKEGNVSPDIDLVISDLIDFPALQKNRDNRSYFPFESIYAIAEIKSTYKKTEKPIAKFTETIEKLKCQMKRDETPNDFVKTGLGSGIRLRGLDSQLPYLNPLFTFMFFVDCGDFDLEDVEELYIKTPRDLLPNAVCFLNKGLLMYWRDPITHPKHYEAIVFPEFASANSGNWALAPQSPEENLAFLWAMLADALSQISLFKPHYWAYVKNVFKESEEGLQIISQQ